MEVAVSDSLGVRCVSSIGVNIGCVGIESLAAYCEGSSIKYIELACLDVLYECLKLFEGAFSSYILINACKNYRALCDTAAPVSSDSFALNNLTDDVVVVRSPVDS